MEAVDLKTDKPVKLSFPEALELFIHAYTLDRVKVNFFLVFKGFVARDNTGEELLSNEDVALFFDQLNDLVSAAYELRQVNGAPHETLKEGTTNG